MTLYNYPDVKHVENDFDSKDLEVLEKLWLMEEKHFWHKLRNKWIFSKLSKYGVKPGARLLEVGCGSGIVSGYLAQQGIDVLGIDTSIVQLEKASLRFPNIDFYCTTLERLPSKFHNSFDAVCLFDVLEHLNNPLDLIRQAILFLKKSGILLATVPGSQNLYSDIDLLSGHKKRYELGELSELFKECDLECIGENYFFRFLYYFLRMHRRPSQSIRVRGFNREERRSILINDTRIPSFIVNQAFNLILILELKCDSILGTRFRGTSLYCLAKKAE